MSGDFRKGEQALEAGDAAEAEALFSQALEAGERPDDALRARATARVRLANYGGAADDLEKWIRHEPDDASPLEIEYVRVLRLAQSLPAPQASMLLSDFSYEEMTRAISLRSGERFLSIDDFITRAERLAGEKYAKAPLEAFRGYLAARIPGRLYRVPALAALPVADAWRICESWVLHGLGASDVVQEIVSGVDMMEESASVPPPPYRQGSDPELLAERCPVAWAFVHHGLLVMSYDLADELGDDEPRLRSELPAIRDAVVKPLVYLGFSVGLETAGI